MTDEQAIRNIIADHRLHILFHKAEQLTGVLGWFQRMHMVHHQTHRYNYFFVSGYVWDALFGTARSRVDAEVAGGRANRLPHIT